MLSCDPLIYPLTFKPETRPYIWGGRNLETVLGRKLPPGKTAESWEISGHAHGPTAVESGHWAGTPLPEVMATLGERLVGHNAAGMLARGKFPLLVKILDAQDNLSVQVHPGDTYALAHSNDLGKVECWYVLHAEPGAELIYGLNTHVTREEFRHAIDNNTLVDMLYSVPIAEGDVVFLRAGTVHALKAGAMVVEIQQNSDATYRVYDWGRIGNDGLPRKLHIDEALDVIDWDVVRPGLVQPREVARRDGLIRWELVRCPQFSLEKVELSPGATYVGRCAGDTFEIWGCIRGEVDVNWSGEPVTLSRVRFALLPATLGDYSIIARTPTVLLRATVPPGN